MPQILRETVFAAAGANPNLFSGSAFEYVRQNAVLSMGAVATVAGAFLTINVGSDVVSEEHPAFIAAAGYPIIPDQFYYQDVAAAMDRIVMAARVTAALTIRSIALITGV